VTSGPADIRTFSKVLRDEDFGCLDSGALPILMVICLAGQKSALAIRRRIAAENENFGSMH
jgi:hypothetical protein